MDCNTLVWKFINPMEGCVTGVAERQYLSDRDSDGRARGLLPHISESFTKSASSELDSLLQFCLLVLHTGLPALLVALFAVLVIL